MTIHGSASTKLIGGTLLEISVSPLVPDVIVIQNIFDRVALNVKDIPKLIEALQLFAPHVTSYEE